MHAYSVSITRQELESCLQTTVTVYLLQHEQPARDLTMQSDHMWLVESITPSYLGLHAALHA